MGKVLISHDLGTSGNKATLFSTDGVMIKSTVETYPTHFFNNNWAEQNPLDWWRAVCITTKRLMVGRNPQDVAAVSFSGQMMACVCVDQSGTILRDAIIWADQRAQKEANEIAGKIDANEFYRIVGHRINASYSFEKLLWIRNNQPDIYKKIYKILLPKDYIVYRLTGKFVTDYSDASGTNAFDLAKLEWSSKIIEKNSVDISIFPEARPSTFVVGGVIRSVAEECGLCAGTPVVLGAGDGACSTVGAGSVFENVAYNYVGSSSWIAYTSKNIVLDEKQRVFNWAHAVPGMYIPCGTMQCAGNSMKFMRDTICGKQEEQARLQHKRVFALMDEAVEKSSIGANGLFYLPYLIGERSPRWNPDAKGAFIGLKMEHKQEDLLRAAVEGVFLNLSLILDVFKEKIDIKRINVLGGLVRGDIERRIMADIYDVDICTLNHQEEATSIGAAIIGGVGVGIFKNFSVASKFITTDETIHPIPKNHRQYERIKKIFDNCYYALIPIYKQIKDL